jgi:hypothetical protein
MPVNGQPSQRAFDLQKYMASLNYDAYNFDLIDGSLKVGLLGSFPVTHANIMFKYRGLIIII